MNKIRNKLSLEEKKQRERNKRLLKTYGITLDEFNQKVKDQDGRCFICKNVPKILCVDHLHIKNYNKMKLEEKRKYVRGLTCNFCNRYVLGGVERRKNSRFILENLIDYFSIYSIKGDL